MPTTTAATRPARKGRAAITNPLRSLATALVAFVVALPGFLALTSSAAAAPRDDNDRPSMEHVVKHRSPRNKQIQPYANERKQRYTSESTQMTSVPPCSALPANRADWPSTVSSCEGPGPAPTRQSVPQPRAGGGSPATPPAGNTVGSPGGGSPANGKSGGGGAARSAPSCR